MSDTFPNPLKRIDIEKKEIVGKSGTVYRIELGHVSVGRYQIYERAATTLMFGSEPGAIFKTFAEIYKTATTGDSTLAALHKITELSHGQMLKIKESSAIKDEFIFCSLFINAEDEDRSVWDINLAERKVADWSEYDPRDFFLLSRSGIEDYINALNHTETLPPLTKTKKETTTTRPKNP
jgi:hypothetical protein